MCSHLSNGRKWAPKKACPPTHDTATGSREPPIGDIQSAFSQEVVFCYECLVQMFRSHLSSRHQSVNSNYPPIHESTNQSIVQSINQSNIESIKLANHAISRIFISIIPTNNIPRRLLARLLGRLRACISQHVRHRHCIHPVGPYATLICIRLPFPFSL